MIDLKGKEAVGVYVGDIPLIAIYKGKSLIWELAVSCIGRGYWVNNLPWKNDYMWNNGV